MKNAIPVLILCFFSAVSCAKKEASYIIETIDGIKVVRNLPGKADSVSTPISFVEDLVLGGEGSGGVDLFYAPVDIDADTAGRVYVLDGKDMTVKQFDRNGDFLRAMGKAGQGPGEFEHATNLEIPPDGRILVADPYRLRYSFFSAEGAFLSSSTMDGYVEGLSSGKNGRCVAGYQDGGRSEYLVGDVDLGTGRFSPVFRRPAFWPARVSNDRFRYDLPHFVRWAVDSRGRLIVGAAVDFEFSVFDAAGVLAFKFKKDRVRVPVEGEMRAKVEEMTALRSPFQKAPNPYLKDLVFPAFESLAVDEKDRIWVESYQPKWHDRINPETSYDVFSPDGVFLFSASLPGHITSKLLFKNGSLYVLKKDSSGFPLAVRFKIRE
ncbi:MAG: hypothetical protein JW843_06490 [Candidatus Aminicenantes bacterium]|nr:hypothetical protein [Candidatus Aminicenantes bacterium]